MTPKLLDRIPWLDADQRKAVLSVIHTPKLALSTVEKQLCALDEICGTQGVEALWTPRDNGWPLATYLNTGDTYAATIIYRRDIVKRWDVLSVDDLVKLLERKGIHCAYIPGSGAVAIDSCRGSVRAG